MESGGVGERRRRAGAGEQTAAPGVLVDYLLPCLRSASCTTGLFTEPRGYYDDDWMWGVAVGFSQLIAAVAATAAASDGR